MAGMSSSSSSSVGDNFEEFWRPFIDALVERQTELNNKQKQISSSYLRMLLRNQNPRDCGSPPEVVTESALTTVLGSPQVNEEIRSAAMLHIPPDPVIHEQEQSMCSLPIEVSLILIQNLIGLGKNNAVEGHLINNFEELKAPPAKICELISLLSANLKNMPKSCQNLTAEQLAGDPTTGEGEMIESLPNHIWLLLIEPSIIPTDLKKSNQKELRISLLKSFKELKASRAKVREISSAFTHFSKARQGVQFALSQHEWINHIEDVVKEKDYLTDARKNGLAYTCLIELSDCPVPTTYRASIIKDLIIKDLLFSLETGGAIEMMSPSDEIWMRCIHSDIRNRENLRDEQKQQLSRACLEKLRGCQMPRKATGQILDIFVARIVENELHSIVSAEGREAKRRRRKAFLDDMPPFPHEKFENSARGMTMVPFFRKRLTVNELSTLVVVGDVEEYTAYVREKSGSEPRFPMDVMMNVTDSQATKVTMNRERERNPYISWSKVKVGTDPKFRRNAWVSCWYVWDKDINIMRFFVVADD